VPTSTTARARTPQRALGFVDPTFVASRARFGGWMPPLRRSLKMHDEKQWKAARANACSFKRRLD